MLKKFFRRPQKWFKGCSLEEQVMLRCERRGGLLLKRGRLLKAAAAEDPCIKAGAQNTFVGPGSVNMEALQGDLLTLLCRQEKF